MIQKRSRSHQVLTRKFLSANSTDLSAGMNLMSSFYRSGHFSVPTNLSRIRGLTDSLSEPIDFSLTVEEVDEVIADDRTSTLPFSLTSIIKYFKYLVGSFGRNSFWVVCGEIGMIGRVGTDL